MYRKTTLAITLTAILTPALLAGCSSKPGQQIDYSVSRPDSAPAEQVAAVPSSTPASAASEPGAQIPVDDALVTGPEQEPVDASLADTTDTALDEIAATLELYPDAEVTEAAQEERPALTLFKFGFDEKELDDQARQIIEQHGEFLAQHPEKKIQLHGHADAQGDPVYNQYLATERAHYVANILRGQGVSEEQIEIFSWGSDKPQTTPEQWQDNRRVELFYDESLMVQAESEDETDTAL